MQSAGASRAAIIVAGGVGFRMGTTIPKQFLLLHGKPVLSYCLRAFYEFDPNLRLIVVLPKEHIDLWKEVGKEISLEIPHEIVAGGEERFFSVRNGIQELKDETLVAVHDGVRPLVSAQTIERVFNAAEEHGAAVPVLPVTDTLRQISDADSKWVDRSQYVRVQTPQCFKVADLRAAYDQPFSSEFTDDASVVEKAGMAIHLVKGNPENLKITGPEDLPVAEAFLPQQ